MTKQLKKECSDPHIPFKAFVKKEYIIKGKVMPSQQPVQKSCNGKCNAFNTGRHLLNCPLGEPVESKGWEELLERLDMSDQESKGCSITLAEWLNNDNVEILKQFIRNLLSQQRIQERTLLIEKMEEIMEYIEHKKECILSQWSAGRPTADGGYESKIGGKWYQVKPINKTPKCNCGLDDIRDTLKEEEHE